MRIPLTKGTLLQSRIGNQLCFAEHRSRAKHNQPLGSTGNEIRWNGSWTTTLQVKGSDPVQAKGYWSMVSVRAGDTWKCQMEMWNVTPKEQKLAILLLFEKKAGQWALAASQPNSADLAAPVKDRQQLRDRWICCASR